MQESGVVFTCCNIIMYVCTCSVVDCCAVANRVLFLFRLCVCCMLITGV